MLTLLMSGWRYSGRPRPPLTVVVGVIAGLFSGVAQVGGPPVVAYWLGGASSAAAVRANIILYFAISSVFSLAAYLWGGLFTTRTFVLALTVAPLYGAGLWCGSRFFGRASETTFRRLCYATIAAAAIISLPLFDPLLR